MTPKSDKEIVEKACIEFDIEPTDEDFRFGLKVAKATKLATLKDCLTFYKSIIGIAFGNKSMTEYLEAKIKELEK